MHRLACKERLVCHTHYPHHHHHTTTTPPPHHHHTTTTPPPHHHHTTTTPPPHHHHHQPSHASVPSVLCNLFRVDGQRAAHECCSAEKAATSWCRHEQQSIAAALARGRRRWWSARAVRRQGARRATPRRPCLHGCCASV